VGTLARTAASSSPRRCRRRSTSCADAYAAARRDPQFEAEFRYELKHYVGRPSPIYHAKRLSEQCGGAQIYIKREN